MNEQSEQSRQSEQHVDISVVVPVYGCPGALPELHRRLTETLSDLVPSYEIILVDDRCPKGSWAVVQELASTDPHVVGVRLSRNFGQSRAITAGLDRAHGDWTVVMDCDCQDPPEAIPELYAKALEGYDTVFARRVGRKDKRSTLAFSRAYYRLYSYLAEAEVDPDVGNFSIASRRAINAYLCMREQGRDYSLFMTWVGFEQAFIDIEPEERFEGKSSYTFHKKASLAIETITAHSDRPLTMGIKAGFVMDAIGLIVLIVLVIRHFVDPSVPMGWPSTIAAIVLVGGIIVSALGVVGIYIGNIFTEVKNRPLYIVEDVISTEGQASGQSNEPTDGQTDK